MGGTREALEAALEEQESSVPGTDSGIESSQASIQASPDGGESQVADLLEAPEVWGAEQREKFKTLDPDWQKFLLDRDKETNSTFTRKTQELGEIQRRYKGLDEVFEPYQEKFLQSGVQPHDVARRLLQWNDAFERDPVRATDALLRTFKLSLPEVISRLHGQQSQVDPALQPIYQEINESRRFREELAQEREYFEQQRRFEALQKDLQKLAEEKDSAGNLKRPHFIQLRGAIQGLIPQILEEQEWVEKDHREIAEEAYKRAYEPLKELLKQQAISDAQKSQKAMRAGSSLGQQGIHSNGMKNPKSTREALSQAWDKLS